MAASPSTPSSATRLQASPQVFINFRGELRAGFISHLTRALEVGGIKYFYDAKLKAGQDLQCFFEEIEKSEIALTIFSELYAESNWCLEELVKIMEKVKEDKMKLIPIFFNVEVDDVKHFTGVFANHLYKGREKSQMLKWMEALESVTNKKALILNDYKSESDFVIDIVEAVKHMVATLLLERKGTNRLSYSVSSVSSSVTITSGAIKQPRTDPPRYGIEQQLIGLEEKLFDFKCAKTRIVGIVGMAGIGKTALAREYYKKWDTQFKINKGIFNIREKSEQKGLHWLKNTFLNGQDLNDKAEVFRKKIFVVLDDVTHKDQVDFLLRNRQLIQNGSKIVITTREKSSIKDLVDDTYLVCGLNDKEALQLFNSHAFVDQARSTTRNFPELSKRFVEYADSNPRALEELGKEICGKDEDVWGKRLETLPHRCNEKIFKDLEISYDQLTDQQKDVFLDVACFFRSEEEDYVKGLLDPCGSDSGEAVRDLAEKLMICISAGRIEMHNLLCTFGKQLGASDENESGERMWMHETTFQTLSTEHVKEETNKVRGIFLDTSKVTKGIPLDTNTFVERFNQKNLRYLKIYDSLCSQQCDVDCKVNLPEGLEFPFEEIRYFHWLKFPLEELPSDFKPKNLIDLRLPYSKIIRVWKVAKEVPRLKWVDLSYSTMLIDLSALSKAYYLQRLNLEGCTNLRELPAEMKYMKSLVFINLRGCIMLPYLPKRLNLISLKTLILSGCSRFNKFELNSENLEFLHLDGTAIKSLPLSIKKFQKLVLLNLKDCKMLESLPYCHDKLKALEEIILSGCEMLTRFPDIKVNMEHLQILLLDGTSIEEVPNILQHCSKFKDQVVCQKPHRMNDVSLLRRLCLSGNKTIESLGSSISQLYHLKWIGLKGCEKLRSISTLPPNLQCLDAHDCVLLETVASPLALLTPTTQQVPSSYIFTNCEKLEHVAKNEIICYAHNKSHLLSEALNRHNTGFASEALVATSFPGSEVPAWFSHRASGKELKPELPRHWSENGFVGIALCAIAHSRTTKFETTNSK